MKFFLEGNELFVKFEQIFQARTTPNQVFDMMSEYSSELAARTEMSKSLIKNTTTSRQRYSDLFMLVSLVTYGVLLWCLIVSYYSIEELCSFAIARSLEKKR